MTNEVKDPNPNELWYDLQDRKVRNENSRKFRKRPPSRPGYFAHAPKEAVRAAGKKGGQAAAKSPKRRKRTPEEMREMSEKAKEATRIRRIERQILEDIVDNDDDL